MKNWNYIEGAKVGNYTPNYRYKGFLITNPEGYEFVVFLQDGLHVGYRGTTSKAQAEDWCDWHDPKTGKPVAKFRNSKTGNELPWGKGINIPGTKEKYTFPDPKEMEKKIQEAIKKGESPAFIEGMKDVLKRAKEERNKRTGNDTPWEYAHRKPKVINDDKTGAEEFFKQLSDDVKEREEKDDADIEKVGNALNWDENLVGKFVWVKDKGQEWKVYVMQDKGDKVYIRDDDGSQGWVSKTRITGKVGNSKIGNRVIEKESEMSQELKNLLKKAPEWIKEKIQYAFSHGFTIDEKDFINAIKKEVGNSASDDKFAYVMREFDEGKLKTPDGKVVTDPAQAKAIAYSESKKTENGLARARNAIK